MAMRSRNYIHCCECFVLTLK